MELVGRHVAVWVPSREGQARQSPPVGVGRGGALSGPSAALSRPWASSGQSHASSTSPGLHPRRRWCLSAIAPAPPSQRADMPSAHALPPRRWRIGAKPPSRRGLPCAHQPHLGTAGLPYALRLGPRGRLRVDSTTVGSSEAEAIGISEMATRRWSHHGVEAVSSRSSLQWRR